MNKLKKLITDAASTLGFPWSKPAAPSSRSTTSSGFAESVSDSDLKSMFERNQAAHAVVSDVATDAFTKFTCTDGKGNELEKFNAEAQIIFRKFISKPLTRALIFTRLYGHAGILIGYADGKKMEAQLKGTPNIQYLQAIPKPWIDQITLKTSKDGGLSLPPELDNYTITISNTPQKIDASRITHIMIPSINEESLEGESALLCIYDDLTTLKSMTWGTGQAMWRHGGGLTAFVAPDSVDQQAQIDAIDELVTDINAMTVFTLPHGSQMLSGNANSLNPKEYFDVCLQMISVGSRIPVSILRGSVAGSLTASEKDRKDYFELLDNIQKEILTPALKDILNRFQASGQLMQKEFMIEWDRTPIWMLEEQRGKLFIAQTELAEAKAKTETNISKKTYIEYKELKEAQKKKTADAVPLTPLPGLILPAPHAELVWRGIQKAIVKPTSMDSHIGKPLYLISDDICYGIVTIDNQTTLTQTEFKTKAPAHMMADVASLERKQKLFYYDIKLVTIFEEPRACTTTEGARNLAKKVEFPEG
jgi:phage-related protein (TIGR01555 family)